MVFSFLLCVLGFVAQLFQKKEIAGAVAGSEPKEKFDHTNLKLKGKWVGKICDDALRMENFAPRNVYKLVLYFEESNQDSKVVFKGKIATYQLANGLYVLID